MSKGIAGIGVALILAGCNSQQQAYESPGMRECWLIEHAHPEMFAECVDQVHQRRLAAMQMDPRTVRAWSGR